MPCVISGSRKWTMQRCMLNVHVSLLSTSLDKWSFLLDDHCSALPGTLKLLRRWDFSHPTWCEKVLE